MAYAGGSSGLPLGGTQGFGGGVSLGFNYLKQGTGISVTYSPSYNGFVQYSKLNAFSHALSITTHKRQRVGAKWQTNFSLMANYQTLTQFLFSQTGLATITSAPATFDDLANGVVTGQFSNDQIATLLTGASLPGSAAEIALYGDRAINAAAQAGFTYAHSSRLSISGTFGATRFQSLPSNNSGAAVALFNSTTSGIAALSVSYSLSPRTQIGAEASTTRIYSPLADMFSNSVTANVGRIISRRWFAQLRAGTGFIEPLGRTQFYQGPQAIGGGGIGYKTLGHTVMLTYDRMSSDAYGLGSQTSSNANAAWTWRPGGGWSAIASGGYMQTTGGPLGRAESWIGRASLSRMLTHQTGMTFAFLVPFQPGCIRIGASLPEHVRCHGELLLDARRGSAPQIGGLRRTVEQVQQVAEKPLMNTPWLGPQSRYGPCI